MMKICNTFDSLYNAIEGTEKLSRYIESRVIWRGILGNFLLLGPKTDRVINRARNQTAPHKVSSAHIRALFEPYFCVTERKNVGFRMHGVCENRGFLGF